MSAGARDGRRFAAILALACLYVVAGKLGLRLAFVHPSATAVWAPSGLALAALLVLGPGVWPGVFLGAFVVNALTAGSLATSLGIAAGNTLEGLVGAWVVHRWAGGPTCFERPRDLFKAALLAGLLSTMIAATCGTASLLLGGFARWEDAESIWVTWWLGDAAGALAVAPLLLLWWAHPRPAWTWREVAELAGLLLVLLFVGLVVFGGWLPMAGKTLPLDFLCTPILAWAALRFSPRETATVALLLAALALRGTLQGLGPFARPSPNESLLLLQMFVGVTTMMALAFAAVVAERRRAEETRRRLAAIVESSDDAIIGTTLDGLVVSWNRGAERLFGYRADEVLGRVVAALFPSDRLGEEVPLIERIRRGESIEHFETVRRHKNGRNLHVSLTISPIRDGSGRIVGVSKIARDMTARKEAEEQVQASLREKEVLLREVHHRVKNNLQVIHSLLRLQSRAISDPKALALFQESQARVRSMAVLHDTLWQSGDLSQINMGQYIPVLTKHLFHSYGAADNLVRLHLDIAPRTLSVETAITCGLLVNELVSNSLKHAFPGGRRGSVRVRFQPAEREAFMLAVQDDGVGFPPGFEHGSTADSLGWQLIPMLVQQLGGRLEILRGQGAAVAITFLDLQYTTRV